MMIGYKKIVSAFFFVIIAAVTLSCNVDIEDGYKTEVDVLEVLPEQIGPIALFDPTVGQIPLPNDLSGLLTLMGLKQSAKVAEGFSAMATGTTEALAAYVEFDQPLDSTTLADGVRMFDAGPMLGDSATEIAELTLVQETFSDSGTDTVRLHISVDGLTVGNVYVVAILNSITGTEDSAYPLQSSPTFYFCKNYESLVDDQGDPTPSILQTMEGGAELAGQAEMLRSYYKPFFDFLLAQGIERTQIALTWSFTFSVEE
jgi:hypothetical protein